MEKKQIRAMATNDYMITQRSYYLDEREVAQALSLKDLSVASKGPVNGTVF